MVRAPLYESTANPKSPAGIDSGLSLLSQNKTSGAFAGGKEPLENGGPGWVGKFRKGSHSIRQRKIDIDFGDDLNRFAVHECRSVNPLLNGFHGGWDE